MISIDPGTNVLGWAVFDQTSQLISAGSIQADSGDRQLRSASIIRKLNNLLFQHSPAEISCEEPLLRGKANKAMERLLGRLEGNFEIPISYYSPTTVKKAMGHGTFDKSMVKAGVLKILSETEREIIKGRLYDSDMTDAIAVGLCHLKRTVNQGKRKTKKQ